MSLAIVALTNESLQVAERLRKELPEADLYVAQTAIGNQQSAISNQETETRRPKPEGRNLTEPRAFSKISQLVADIFHKYDGLVFIMALGIVIRAIAPYAKDKHSDPAVVVVDEAGRFVISALSGHEGGANALAARVASILHTEAVITTGTEARKDIIIGFGCKANASADEIKGAIKKGLEISGLPQDRVRLLATIKERAELPEVIKAAQELEIPLRVFSREEIATCAKEYTTSKFVEEKMGIGGVCEPAALLAGRKTRLILKKQKFSGITIAIAQENLVW